MIHIRPVSDLRNKFVDIERAVGNGEPIFLTKNGYGSMVVLSLEKYAELTEDIEHKQQDADNAAIVQKSMNALKRFQEEMAGEAEKAGLLTEDDVVALCREVRRERCERVAINETL